MTANAPADWTTERLLSRCRDGDGQARNLLVARVQPLLQRFARGRVPGLLRHQQDTADLVQLTWLKALDRIPEFQSRHPGAFFAYLREILLNALRESMRRHRPLQDIERTPEAEFDASMPAGVAPEDWLAYEQSLARLDEAQRAMVLMRFEFGMSYPEIGLELGQSPDAVRVRVNRALARMAGQDEPA